MSVLGNGCNLDGLPVFIGATRGIKAELFRNPLIVRAWVDSFSDESEPPMPDSIGSLVRLDLSADPEEVLRRNLSNYKGWFTQGQVSKYITENELLAPWTIFSLKGEGALVSEDKNYLYSHEFSQDAIMRLVNRFGEIDVVLSVGPATPQE